MSGFDDFKKMAKETMGTIADRSVELYKVAEEKTKVIAKRTKLSAEIAVEKGGIRNLYKEIGKMYYALHNTEPEPELKQLCEEVSTAMNLIEAKQAELDELKNISFVDVDYTEPPASEPEDSETVTEVTAEPSTEETPASGTYNAASEAENTQPKNEWQNKYPPEFRM